MTQLRWPLLVFLLAAALTGCSDDDGGGGNPITVTSLPSEIGTRWSYDFFAALENIRILVPGTALPADTIQGIASVTVRNVVTLSTPGYPSVDAKDFEKEEFSFGAPQTTTSHSYYTVTDSGLYLQGYAGGGTEVPPTRKPTAGRIVFAGRPYSTISELIEAAQHLAKSSPSDSINREIPPLCELPFPLAAPKEWTYRPSGNPFQITKRAEKDTTLGFGIASYPCVVVRWLYDLDGNGVTDWQLSIEDDVSSIGFLRRTILFRDLSVTSDTGPEVVAIVDLRATYTLTAFVVP